MRRRRRRAEGAPRASVSAGGGAGGVWVLRVCGWVLCGCCVGVMWVCLCVGVRQRACRGAACVAAACAWAER